MTIHLGRPLPDASRDLPGRRRENPPGDGLSAGSPVAPMRSCSRWGLPCRSRCRSRGALLPHPFTLAGPRVGGLLSVALSLGSPPPDVIRHRVFVEPGLSSPGAGRKTDAKGSHPAVWHPSPRPCRSQRQPLHGRRGDPARIFQDEHYISTDVMTEDRVMANVVTINRPEVVALIEQAANKLTGGNKTEAVALALRRLLEQNARAGSLFGAHR